MALKKRKEKKKKKKQAEFSKTYVCVCQKRLIQDIIVIYDRLIALEKKKKYLKNMC